MYGGLAGMVIYVCNESKGFTEAELRKPKARGLRLLQVAHANPHESVKVA